MSRWLGGGPDDGHAPPGFAARTKQEDVVRHPSGLHFNLAEEAYHADHALGSGAIRALAKCPIYYWIDSHMNPLREEPVETEALLYGRALHKLVLEGVEAFQQAYRCEPDQADYPEAIVTADDCKRALRAAGGKLTGSKAELVARVRELVPDAVIWDDVLEKHAADCTKSGATSLKAKLYRRVVVGAGYISSDPRVRAAFQGGRSEVSLLWEQDGVPMKARLDYVRLGKGSDGAPIAIVCDLKSFANILDKPPEVAVVHAIANTRLDIQAAAYLQGIARIPEFVASGQVFGAEGVNADWLALLGSIPLDRWLWSWVFYEKDAPVALLRQTRPGSAMIEAATMDLLRAQQAYRENMQVFGTAWRFVDPLPDPEISQSDLPKWMMMGA
jgi:hypothetical protein